MARISGVDLPNDKRIEVALTYIFGVGTTRSREILAATGINPDTKARELTDDELLKLREYIDTGMIVEGDLRREVRQNIARLIEINCYRGQRHRRNLPSRGQNTRTNARQRRGTRKTDAGKKSAGKKGAGKRGTVKTGVFCYTLTPLSPFRNKPVNPARTQLLQSQKTITDRQLKAWFAKTFHDLFGDWPAPQRMPWIRFSSCRPALKAENKITAAYFPPFSTLQFEDGSIKDCFGVKREENDPADLENFAHVKAKPLKESIFLTKANRPSAFALKTQKRLRNSITPAFATLEEGGLFVQELVEKDQPFCGTVTLTGDNNDFLRKAHFILEKVYPKINGAFFEPHVEKLTPEINAVGEEDPTVFVLTEPVNYSPGRMAQACQVRLDTLSNYNTMLRRPRRNRIVFAPGSLVYENFDGAGITWQGLSRSDPVPVDARLLSKPVPATAPHSELPQPEAALKSLTRAQAGNLRRFLEMKPDVAKNRIEALLNKYDRWETKTIAKHLIPKEYLKEAKDLLDRGNTPAFKVYIKGILERFALAAWEEKSKKAAGKADEGGPHGDAE